MRTLLVPSGAVSELSSPGDAPGDFIECTGWWQAQGTKEIGLKHVTRTASRVVRRILGELKVKCHLA
jgi:hypothetical protein